MEGRGVENKRKGFGKATGRALMRLGYWYRSGRGRAFSRNGLPGNPPVEAISATRLARDEIGLKDMRGLIGLAQVCCGIPLPTTQPALKPVSFEILVGVTGDKLENLPVFAVKSRGFWVHVNLP